MSTTKKSKGIERIKNSNKFPEDFWNYSVNHILGYYYDNNVTSKYDRQ